MMLANALALPNTLRAGVFSLDAFMAAQSDGFAFDFTATDRLFQENTGGAPADDAGEVIGLALDSRTWGGKTLAQEVAAATELVTNGGFTGGTGWTTDDGSNTFSGGQAVYTSTPQFLGVRQAVAALGTVGKVFRTTYDTTVSVGAVQSGFIGSGSNVIATARTSSGSYVSFLQSVTGNNEVKVRAAAGGFTGSVDNVSVKEITGKHGIQATLNYRGKFQATGKKYDGLDDFDVTTEALSGATNAFAFDYADIPASIAATQILFGAQNVGGEAFYLAVTTGGALRAKVGTTTIDSTGVDIRGGQHALGVYTRGTAVYLMVDGVVVGSGTYAGAFPATAWYLGAVNNNGTSAAFFGGSLMFPLTGRDAITESRARQICNSLTALAA